MRAFESRVSEETFLLQNFLSATGPGLMTKVDLLEDLLVCSHPTDSIHCVAPCRRFERSRSSGILN